MAISAARIAKIRSHKPSEAATDRAYRNGARTREQAIDMCHQRIIDAAERESVRTVWHGSYGPKRGPRAVVSYTTLTNEQRGLINAGIPPLDYRPEDQADCLHLANFYSSSGQPPAGEAVGLSLPVPTASSFHLIAAE